MEINNLIVIKGGTFQDLKKALNQWTQLYLSDSDYKLSFEFYKNSKGDHLIKADPNLEEERFFYLVNYLKYPEYVNYNIEINAYKTVANTKKLKNQSLLIFLQENDNEYDNIYAVTKNNCAFKIDFGGVVTAVESTKQYSEPDLSDLTFIDKVVYNKIKIVPDLLKNPKDKATFRFHLIFFIILFLYIVSLFTLNNTDTFLGANYVICFAVYGWLFTDYKLLQVTELYLKCFILSIAIFAYGIFLDWEFGTLTHKNSIKFGASLPLGFLLLQKPLRLLFLKIFKREPVVSRPANTFVDFIYIFFTLLIPIFILAQYL